MRHTYLFEEGDWAGDGHISDREGRRLAVTGRLEVRHEAGVWHDRRSLRTDSQPPVIFRQDYQVEPFRRGEECTACTAWDSLLGDFDGTVAITGDSLLIICRGDGGEQWALECLVGLAATRYLSRGVHMSRGRLVSSWAIELNRIQ